MNFKSVELLKKYLEKTDTESVLSEWNELDDFESDIEKLKKLPNSHRFIFVKDFPIGRLKNIADELYIPYDEHDDIQYRVLRYFEEEYSKG